LLYGVVTTATCRGRAMNIYQWMDTVQTAMLIVVGGVMVYLLLLFRGELKQATALLREVVSSQALIRVRLDRLERERPGPPGPSP
jgi:hypothetical protein